MTKHFIFIISVISVWLPRQVHAQLSVETLTCEWRQNPLGIDIKNPRLSWQINSSERNVQQNAYEILVASTPDRLQKNEGDIWKSGKVISTASVGVRYGGKKLASRNACYWKVKVFTNKGESPWSEMNYWTMGLLDKSDWKAKWIGYDKPSPWDSISTWSRLSARYIRKEFTSSSEIKRATVFVSGLGLYELFINGNKTGDAVLAPAPTDYRKSVLYNTYDVTKQLRQGQNAIAVVLGNGRFFTMRQNYKPKKINTFGYPKLLLQLEIEYANGTKKIISSDETWELNVDGPIRTDNEYDGEEYDATKEFSNWDKPGFNDAAWMNAALVAAPSGKLSPQMQEPMEVMKHIQPVSIKKLGDRYILDMGQNFAGWLRLRAKGKRGDEVKLRFAESLQANGELYTANLRDARAKDIYTLKGGTPEIWHPVFVYHGFRYVEITGYPGTPSLADFEGQLIYDNLQTIGSFVCSDTIINKIYQNAWWGIASDYKGMPVDCPQRNERQPWLGDRAQGAYGESFLFNNVSLYSKWLNDIEESQTPAGAIPDVAPAFWNYYSDNMTWPGTYLLVAEMLYHQYGDVDDIVRHYASMKKWMKYMKQNYMKEYLVTKDKYGDWCVPPEDLQMIRSRDSLRNTNGELIATAYYYHLLQLMEEFAVISNNKADIKGYKVLQVNIRRAFNKRFYNPSKGCYDNNTVTANLLPLHFGITPLKLRRPVFENIYKKIVSTDNTHISSGVIGTQWLMRTLTDFKKPEISFALASTKTYPGWGYMVENGATTIWELWNGNTASPKMNSQNHVMLLGDLLIWLYEDVAGIKSDAKEVAFKKIIMKPSFSIGLNDVNASYQSCYGMISSDWQKENGLLDWSVNIPANTKAIVYIPAGKAGDVTESGKPAINSNGVHFLRMENGNALFEIGSGRYSFTTNSSFIK